MRGDPFVALALASLTRVTGGRYTNIPPPDPVPGALAQVSQQLAGAKQMIKAGQQEQQQRMFGFLQNMLQNASGGGGGGGDPSGGGAGGGGGSGAPTSPA